MAYELYMICNASEYIFSGTPDYNPILKYDPATGDWNTVSVPIFNGYYYLTMENAYSDVLRSPEGPIMLGSIQLVPAWAESDVTSPDPTELSWVKWDRTSGDGSIERSIMRTVWVGSVGFFPMAFSVEEDPDNAGQYFVSGGISMVAHWDGSSARFTNWDDSIVTYNWSNVRSTSLSGTSPDYENGTTTAYMGGWTPSYPNIRSSVGGFMFQLGGYFWFCPLEPQRLYESGTKSQMGQVLYKLENSGDTPTDTSKLGAGSMHKFFPTINAANFGNTNYTVPQAWHKPIYWQSGVVLNMVRHSRYNSGLGSGTIDDLNFAWYLKSDGTVIPMGANMAWTSPETQARSMGCYLHPDTGKLFAFYKSMEGTSSPFNIQIHILELTAYNLTTPSFTWTERGVISTGDGEITSNSEITSNGTHLFIVGVSDQKIHRYNISTFGLDYWQDASFLFDAPNIFMRFGSPDVQTYEFATII